MKIKGHHVLGEHMDAMRRALQYELDDPRGYTWYNHVAARAVVYEQFPDVYHGFWSIPCLAAARVIQEERRAGRIRHLGAGRWARVR